MSIYETIYRPIHERLVPSVLAGLGYSERQRIRNDAYAAWKPRLKSADAPMLRILICTALTAVEMADPSPKRAAIINPIVAELRAEPISSDSDLEESIMCGGPEWSVLLADMASRLLVDRFRAGKG